MKFTPLSKEESQKLGAALRSNAEINKPLMMDTLTTGWKPGEDESITDEETIDAIKSIPCHY
jgi:hypothetical protein